MEDRRTAVARIIAAHLSLLAQEGVIDPPTLSLMLRALDSAMADVTPPAGGIIAEIASLDERAAGQLPVAIAGALSLGLSRGEIATAVLRISLRDAGATLADASLTLRARLITLASAHTVTVMPAMVDGHIAAPTTLAHYLGGVIAPLTDAGVALWPAIDRVDRSPLGAGLLAGDPFSTDRAALATALGFAAPIPQTLHALADVEDAVSLLHAAAGLIAPLARFVADLLRWMQTDAASFFVDESWLARPDPAHPALEIASRLTDLQRDLRATLRLVESTVTGLREIAYGPVGSALDGMATTLVEALICCEQGMSETRALIDGALIVNRAWLANRAGREFSTAPDLVPFLMQEERLSPTAARQIAALAIARLQERNLEVSAITPDIIDAAAVLVIGRELKVEMEPLGRFLAPRRFLERRDVLGSPAAERTRAWLAAESATVQADREQLDRRRKRWSAAMAALDAALSRASTGDE